MWSIKSLTWLDSNIACTCWRIESREGAWNEKRNQVLSSIMADCSKLVKLLNKPNHSIAEKFEQILILTELLADHI